MELRSRNHLHFLHVIKGGSSERVLNVDTHERPKLRLGHLEDIYRKEAPDFDEWIPKIQPRVVRDLDYAPDMTDGPWAMADWVNIKHESEDYDAESKADVYKIDGTAGDDLGFCDVTLKQIRKRCKANKRKRQHHRNTPITSGESRIKQECLTLQPEDEGCDLEQPLSCWATKFSKKRKEEKRRKKKCSAALSPATQKGVMFVSCDVKPEPLEDCHPVSEAITSNPADPFPNCNKAPSAFEMVSIEVPVTTKPMEEAMVYEPNEFPDTIRQAECSVDKFPLENQENADTEVARLVDNSEGTDLQNSDFSASEYVNNGCANNLISSETILENEDANEKQESVDQETGLGVKVSDGKITMVESQETLATEFSGLAMVGLGENHMTPTLSSNFSETGCLETSYHLEKDQLVCSIDYSSPSASSRSQVQEANIDHVDHVPESDLKIPESSCEIGDTAMDDSLVTPERDVISHQDGSGAEDNMISVDEDQLSEKRQSASSGYIDTTGERDSIQFSNALESVNIQPQKLQHPPEKLLSGRKIISPVSQAKLCKAMEQPDSPEKRSNKCKGKLYFSSQNAHRILKAQGLGDIERIEVTPNTKQAVQKPNNLRRTRYTNPTLKIPRKSIRAATSRRFSTACTTIQGCSQNAIAFSRRQMHDFRNLATKLTNELQSMKEMTERYLQHEEGSPSKLSEYNADEVEITIGNAERAEETARKWLSIMERNCNRFCKLMGMVQEDSAAPENLAQTKKRKRITFADDVGGDLCQVKVFEI